MYVNKITKFFALFFKLGISMKELFCVARNMHDPNKFLNSVISFSISIFILNLISTMKIIFNNN